MLRAISGCIRRKSPDGLPVSVNSTSVPPFSSARSHSILVGNGPSVLSTATRLGGSCSVIFHSYWYSRPIERRRVRTVLPTRIGSDDVSSSLITSSSHSGRLRASATYGKTSSRGRETEMATLRVNTGPP